MSWEPCAENATSSLLNVRSTVSLYRLGKICNGLEGFEKPRISNCLVWCDFRDPNPRRMPDGSE